MEFDKLITFNFKQVLIDEIALNGLEGIGTDLLWQYVQKRVSAPITEKMKSRFWNFIKDSNNIALYRLGEPVAKMQIIDRFTVIDEETGNLLDSEEHVDGPYEYCPILNQYGSSLNYEKRKLIPKDDYKDKTYQQIHEIYGNHLVMVASIEERWKALAPHMSISYLSELTAIHYCMLELVGKARENGQMTVGNTNLTKIVKDAKLLFYNRNHLQRLDLIRVVTVTQVSGTRGYKSLLLRLKRFHKPSVLTLPKCGKIYNIMQYLLKQPGYCEKTDVIIKKGMLSQKMSKRLQKTINIFHFPESAIEKPEDDKELKSSKASKRRFITLNSRSDESSQSEDESPEVPIKCQYKMGVSLLRQAYELFLKAGLKGLTIIEIGQLLGVEFYTSRTICRLFKLKHLIREFLEDKGKQRTARYIAVVATGDIDVKYDEEKKKFLEYLDKGNINKDNIPCASIETLPHTEEVPIKKIKLEIDETEETTNIIAENIETITELQAESGYTKLNPLSILNSKREPTLRQLKYANGVLKISRERLCISGYQTLSTLVAREIGEAPMDTKALKLLVQRLVADGQLKLFKFKWKEIPSKVNILICAPHIKSTDPLIRSKYKESTVKAFHNLKVQKMKKDVVGNNHNKSLCQFSYPRYMKIQKLHEFLMRFAYFDENRPKTELPQGFVSIHDFMPEITVQFALGNISNVAISDMSHLQISNNILDLKISQAPDNLYPILLQSKSLVNSIKFNIRALAMLGLVQLIYRDVHNKLEFSTDLLNYTFYMNRNAKIINTTGAWPRDNVNVKNLEKKYYFNTFDDVKNYWREVYDISTSTTILTLSRNRKMAPPVQTESEAGFCDNGTCYGDGLGPCGFDSGFYMDIPRLWSTFYLRPVLKPNKPPNPPVSIPKLEKIKRKKLPKPKKKKVQKPPTKEVKINFRPKVKKPKPDSVIWNNWEDRVLIMCKAAITIMSPAAHPGCLRVRNTVASIILSIRDPNKTPSACHRRGIQLETNSTLIHEKDCIIYELKRNRHLIRKYEGFLKKLRLRYSTNMSKYCNEAKIPVMELIWLIIKLLNSVSFNHKIPCVAMNFEEFHKNMTITQSNLNKPYNIYQTPIECGPVIATVKEGMVMTTMLSYKRTLSRETAKKIYNLYKLYPEQTLRISLDDLRKSGAIAAKEKILNAHLDKYDLKTMVQSPYKISANYARRWICRLNSEWVVDIADRLMSEIPNQNIKGSPDLNCVFCELHASGALDIFCLTAPVITGTSDSILQEEQLSVLDAEIRYKLKSGSVGWDKKINVETFSELYQSIEYEHVFDKLCSDAVLNEYEEELDLNDEIINYLNRKSEDGAIYSELEKQFGNDDNYLVLKLDELTRKGAIKLVGLYENRLVLTQFAKKWALKMGDTYIFPTPWLTLEPCLRHNIFLNWVSVVMNKVFCSPGCSIEYLAQNCELLTTRSVQDIVRFLEACECVNIKICRSEEPSFFSDDDSPVELSQFHPYESPNKILIYPVKDSLTKFAYIKKIMLQKYNVEDVEEKEDSKDDII